MNVRNLFWEMNRKTTKTIADTIVKWSTLQVEVARLTILNKIGCADKKYLMTMTRSKQYYWCWGEVSFLPLQVVVARPLGQMKNLLRPLKEEIRMKIWKNWNRLLHKAWTIDVKYDELYRDEIEGENGFHGNTWCVEVDCCGLTELWRTHWVVRPGAAQSKTQMDVHREATKRKQIMNKKVYTAATATTKYEIPDDQLVVCPWTQVFKFYRLRGRIWDWVDNVVAENTNANTIENTNT